jgi:hypothetical protein
LAQLITLSLLGICVAAAVILGIVVLVLALLGSPQPSKYPLGRVVGASTAALLLTATVIVAQPSFLDPLADDFEWFGAKTASTARQYAYVARAPLGRVAQSR